jgi:DNA mismatch repair ATPase MutS
MIHETLFDKYLLLKKKHSKVIILVKYGKFYLTFNKECFNYLVFI